MHSINYILLQFFAAAGIEDFGKEELERLAAQFADGNIQCCIKIYARTKLQQFVRGQIIHTPEEDVHTAAV